MTATPPSVSVVWDDDISVAPYPANEQERLDALHRSGMLDTPPEAAFDDLTNLAATLCGTPIALISLVDRDRQWFKSRVGLQAAQTPREIAFCAHAILDPEEVMEVADALNDQRFAGNPLVRKSPSIRFYAGAPIVNEDGLPLGTVCVIDRKPKSLSPAQKASLKAIARLTSELVRLRRAD